MPRKGRSTLVAAILLAALACALVLLLPRTDPQGSAGPRAAAEPTAAESEPLDAPPPVAATAGEHSTERVALEQAAVEDPAQGDPPEPVPFRPLDVYGRVVDALDATPVVGARLVVTRDYPTDDAPLESDALLGALETDDEGRFSLPELGRLERAVLSIEAEGYAPHRRPVQSGRDEEVRLQPARAVAGRVLRRADRTPVAGTRVRWAGAISVWSGERFQSQETFTDASGAFRLEGLREGTDAQLWIRPPGGQERRHRIRWEQLDGELELLVGEMVGIAVRLVSLEGGVPLPGVSGTIEHFGAFEADGAGVVRLLVEHDAFELATPSGQLKLFVDAQGFCRSSLLLSRATGEGEPRDLPLTRGWTLTGMVSDADGTPIGGATVHQVTGICRNLHRPEESFPGLPPGVVIDPPPWPEHTAVSAEDGTYRLERAFSSCLESVTFHARAPARKTGVLEIVGPLPGSVVTADFTLESCGATLSGRVLRNGEPARLCRVGARQGSGLGSRVACETNDAGEYALEGLEPGALTLEVRTSPDRDAVSSYQVLLHSEELVLDPGSTVHDVVFEDQLLPLAGVVRDADGTPVEGALVYPRVESGQWTNGASGIGAVQTNSDSAGRFRLSVEASGEPYGLVAYTDGASVSARVSAGDEDVELVLPVRAVLLLDVREAGTDQVVRQLDLVEGWPSGTPRGAPALFGFRSSADEEGLHGFELARDTWDLVVQKGGYAPGWVLGLPVGEGSSAVRVELDPGRSLRVRYVDAPEDLARLAPYAVLEEELERANAGDMWIWMGVQSFLGRRFPVEREGGLVNHLGPGRYVVQGSSEEWTFDPDRFEIDADGDATLELRWVGAEGR